MPGGTEDAHRPGQAGLRVVAHLTNTHKGPLIVRPLSQHRSADALHGLPPNNMKRALSDYQSPVHGKLSINRQPFTG